MNNSLNALQEYFSFQDSSHNKDDQSHQFHYNDKDSFHLSPADNEDSAITDEMEELYAIEQEIQLKHLQIQNKTKELTLLKARYSDGKIIKEELNHHQLDKCKSNNMHNNNISFTNKIEELKKQENVIKMKEIILDSIMIQPNKSMNNNPQSSNRAVKTIFKYEKPIKKNKEKIIYQRNIIEYINKRDANHINSKRNNNNSNNDISNSNSNSNRNNDNYITPLNKRKPRQNSSECNVNNNNKMKKKTMLSSEKENSFILDKHKQNKSNIIRTCLIDLNAKSNSKISSTNTTIISDIVDVNIANSNQSKQKKRAMMMSSSKRSLSMESNDKSINKSFIPQDIQGKDMDDASKSTISAIVLSRNTSQNEIPKNYSKVIRFNQSREKNKSHHLTNKSDNSIRDNNDNKANYSKSFIDEKTKELINQTIANINTAKKLNANQSFDNNNNHQHHNDKSSKRSRNGSIDSKKTSLLSGLLTRILKEETKRLLMKSSSTKVIINELGSSMFVSKENNGNKQYNKHKLNINEIRRKSIDKCDFAHSKNKNIINRMINIDSHHNIKAKTNNNHLKANTIDDFSKIATTQNEACIHIVNNNNDHHYKYKKIRVNKSLPHINNPDVESYLEQSNISYVSVGNQKSNVPEEFNANNVIKQAQDNNNNSSNKANCNSSNCNNNQKSIILSANNSMKVLKESQDNTNENTNTNISQYSNKTPIKENQNALSCSDNKGLDINSLGSKSCSSISNNTQVKNMINIQNSAKESYLSKKSTVFTNESKSDNNTTNNNHHQKKSLYDHKKLLKNFIIALEKNCIKKIRKINIINNIKQYAGKTTFYYLLNKYIPRRSYYNQLYRFFFHLRKIINNKRKVVQVEELPNDSNNLKCEPLSQREVIFYQNNLNKLKEIAFTIKTYEAIVKEIALRGNNWLDYS